VVTLAIRRPLAREPGPDIGRVVTQVYQRFFSDRDVVGTEFWSAPEEGGLVGPAVVFGIDLNFGDGVCRGVRGLVRPT